MRTTLTLDKDVAAMIERLRKTKRQSLKDIVNEALREGLKHTGSVRRNREVFRTTSVDLGRCLSSSVDNAADVLAVAQKEWFK